MSLCRSTLHGLLLATSGWWCVCAGAATPPATNPALHTQNVVLIVPDGLRWQEVFTGAEKALLNDKDGGSWLDERAGRYEGGCSPG